MASQGTGLRGCAAGKGGRLRRAFATALALLPVAAVAQEDGQPPRGSGFIWGASIGGGRLSFPGGSDDALALGPVEGRAPVPGTGSTVGVRDARVIGADTSAPAAALVVPLPAAESAGGFSMHAGYAFSRRVAVLLAVGVSGGLAESDFNHAVGALVVRLWPAARFWLQGGPALGDLGYGSGDTVVAHQSITGTGFEGAAGVCVVRRPTWSLDVEVRYSRVGYEGFRASSVTFGLGATRVPR